MSWRVETSLQVPISAPNSAEKRVRSNKVVQVAQSVVHGTQHESNGAFLEIPDREPLYLTIDGTGGFRQLWEIVVNSLLIGQTAGGPAAAAATAAVGFCILKALCVGGLGITGMGNTFIALKWWLQDAKQDLKANKEKLALLESVEKLLKLSPNELQDLEASIEKLPEVQKVLESLGKMGGKIIDKRDLAKMKEEVAGAVEIAKLSVTSHKLYAVMGVGQTTLATVTMLTDAGSKACLHAYAPVLTGAAGVGASSGASMALGVIYILRGLYMRAQAKKSQALVQDFRGQFNQFRSIDGAMRFMAKEEQRSAVDGSLTRRVNATCLKGLKGGTYTANGFKPDEGALVPYADDKEKLEYLKRIDKGIYTQELKQSFAQKIAKAMIVGGAFAFIAGAIGLGVLLLSNPVGLTALLVTIAVIGLISAMFFCSVEYIFLTYDSTKLFGIVRDFRYRTAQWIQDIEKAVPKKEVELSQEKSESDDTVKPEVEQSKKESEIDHIKILEKETQEVFDDLERQRKKAFADLAALDKETRETLAALGSDEISA